MESRIASCSEVLEWMVNAVESEDEDCSLSPCTLNIGHIKIAFERAFFYLYNDYEYVAAIAEVIQSGGDTDTNGCIIGALLGCYHGLSRLEQETAKYKWCDNIRNCKPTVDYEKRKRYQPRIYFEQKLVERLLF